MINYFLNITHVAQPPIKNHLFKEIKRLHNKIKNIEAFLQFTICTAIEFPFNFFLSLFPQRRPCKSEAFTNRRAP